MDEDGKILISDETPKENLPRRAIFDFDDEKKDGKNMRKSEKVNIRWRIIRIVLFFAVSIFLTALITYLYLLFFPARAAEAFQTIKNIF